MKLNKIILPVAAAGLLFTSCDDQKMEWGTPDGHYPVTTADIPLAVKEVIANYDDIKTYAEQYTPNLIVGLGFGASQYVSNTAYAGGPTYRGLTDANYQMVTPGNAMKHDAIITNSGAFNFTTVDQMLDAMAENPGLKLYGHNFIWHTQQKQTYLKSLIAPTLVIETDSDIDPMIAGDAADFNGGTTGGWGSWGSNKEMAIVVEGAGEDGSSCLVLKNKADGNAWEAQNAYTFSDYLDPNTEYTIRFKARSSSNAGQLQFQYQNSSTYGSQGGYNTFNLTSSWQTFEYSFTPAYADVDRIIFNFGAVSSTYYIDDIEFGIKKEDPMENVLVDDDSDFEGGTTGKWASWGNSSTRDAASPGYDGSEYCMHLTNPTDASAWVAQCAYTFSSPLESGKKYMIQFYAKSSVANGSLQFQYQNSSSGSQGGYNTFPVGTDWQLCEFSFTPTPEDACRICLNFGAVGAEYWIDNVKFGLAKDQSTASNAKVIKFVKNSSSKSKAVRRSATKSYYVLKTAEEKREALLGAMDAWISGMASHLKEKGVTPYGYDVLNEAITDGNKIPRGIKTNGKLEFNGEDTEPTEDVADGLTLNWDDDHFYWGYYIGDDYAAQAFTMARKYLPAETKLFLNDYNLETSPQKRQAFIDFAKSIDAKAGQTVVDGLGTQCHLTLDISSDDSFDQQIEAFMAQVDASLTDLAATGKFVRITELDISLGTATPSSTQLQAQYEAYKRVFESYKRIVPADQQSGITIWTLSDNADEHTYWLPDESPNLFDKDGLRKWAYKGVCDGIAGEDLGLKFNGDDYKAWYEKNNTGNW